MSQTQSPYRALSRRTANILVSKLRFAWTNPRIMILATFTLYVWNLTRNDTDPKNDQKQIWKNRTAGQACVCRIWQVTTSFITRQISSRRWCATGFSKPPCCRPQVFCFFCYCAVDWSEMLVQTIIDCAYSMGFKVSWDPRTEGLLGSPGCWMLHTCTHISDNQQCAQYTSNTSSS